MILIINTSGANLEFVLDTQYKSVQVEKQSVALPTECEKFITECGAKWSDITAIGVVTGPGSFTGIRLGIAYAKGIAMGLNIPVVGISAFDLYLASNPNIARNKFSEIFKRACSELYGVEEGRRYKKMLNPNGEIIKSRNVLHCIIGIRFKEELY
jgi:tRNA threonylcarbamoyl adenosine modification protein YeaZ